MKGLSDYIKESSVTVENLAYDVKEAFHHIQDKKEMMAYLNAIVNALQDAQDMRKDPMYMPRNQKRFDEANELLNAFIAHMQDFA